MLYSSFGNTGLTISRIGFGGMRFENPADTEAMAEIVYHAFERGITYFDTAPTYCDDYSETIMGIAVKEMQKTQKPFYLSSKTMAADPDAVRRQCETSIERLHVDALDFYHVWCLVQPEDLGKRKAKGVLRAFRQLKEEGLVRHISVSTHLEHQYVEAMLEEGEGLFESMLIGLNLQNYHLRKEGVRAAADRGLAVVTMNTLGGGVLTEHEKHFRHVTDASQRTMVHTALHFNLSVPGVTTALVGFRNKADVDDAVAALDSYTPMDQQAIDSLTETMSSSYKEYCTQCGYCRDCPEHIPVVRMMEAYNFSLMDAPGTALRHLKYHWNITDVEDVLAACTQCRQCEAECTQQLPILDRFEALKEAQRQGLGKEE
ncbi:MAG: hypothetical protein GX117_14235 [Candidatus Hydrogenedentes bacterium]|jgi:predicted aldo/keto reductase-like oxidoreductase|nr:hypothetical protein [Candidatus Hydrogenedentota bacterium]